jgi:hypothetical protein
MLSNLVPVFNVQCANVAWYVFILMQEFQLGKPKRRGRSVSGGGKFQSFSPSEGSGAQIMFEIEAIHMKQLH